MKNAGKHLGIKSLKENRKGLKGKGRNKGWREEERKEGRKWGEVNEGGSSVASVTTPVSTGVTHPVIWCRTQMSATSWTKPPGPTRSWDWASLKKQMSLTQG